MGMAGPEGKREEVAGKNREGKSQRLLLCGGHLAERTVSFWPWREGLDAVELSPS